MLTVHFAIEVSRQNRLSPPDGHSGLNHNQIDHKSKVIELPTCMKTKHPPSNQDVTFTSMAIGRKILLIYQ